MGSARKGDEDRATVEDAFRQASMSMSIFDADQRYLRLNRVACEVMGATEPLLQGRVYPYGVPEGVESEGMARALREVAATGRPYHLEAFTRAPSGIREHAWNLEFWPVRDEDGRVYAVGLAAFDSSEQHWARQRLAILDEAALTLGRSLDLERTAQELAALVVPRFADFASVDLLEEVMRGDEPGDLSPTASVVLRRVAHLSPEEGTPGAVIGLGATDTYPPFSPPARALLTGQAVLSRSGEQEFDLWIAGAPARAEKLRGYTVTSLVATPLIARGVTLGVAVLLRTRPDPFNEDDFALAKEIAGRAALCVDNARRYERERSTALALQRSLLPRGTRRQPAVDVACRYLPTDTRAGVGGDWFDIIPLSGARVGLVVGDVVGHGIQASATMGRLRMAVQTLADVDLPPDELLAHLDDLVLHLHAEDETDEYGRIGAEPADAATGEIGATCLYAVYDPISRTLTAASAGHPAPVVVLPDGIAEPMPVSAGPVLGVGGLPFETSEIQLPPGSVVALFSDGLIEADHDPDQGMARLLDVLRSPEASLDECCDRLLTALLPRQPRDDVALVLARTKALDTHQVRVWEVAADPEAVSPVRRAAAEQLLAWGLDDAGFVTELVVSELVTNAIRYGAEPIQLRLIYDHVLICEVSDGSSTAPHLRRARLSDEGGRGLLLVAQLTSRWGTRHTATGKTIWAEQLVTPVTGSFGLDH